jgi:acyl-CoA thioesterase-2
MTEALPPTLSARAWWGNDLVAESDVARCLDDADGMPILLFPLADVRLSSFEPDEGTTASPDKGPLSAWSIAPTSTPYAGSVPQWGGHSIDTSDGQRVLQAFVDPPTPYGWMKDHGAFDHHRVYLEVVDLMDATDPDSVTLKRFPVWGDASELIHMLDVRAEGSHRFTGIGHASQSRAVVEGSQMLAQSIVAAGHDFPDRRMVSSHMVFMRAADPSESLTFVLDPLTSGRTMTTLSVDVTQGDRLYARGTLLLDVTADDLIRHAAPPPVVPGPYECAPYDMAVTGRDIRVVDDAYSDDPSAPVGPPVIDAWVRFRQVPGSPFLHAALLAQFAGHMPIAAALRAHQGIGQREAHRTISTAINAIGLSLHADIRADQWMLYHHEATFAGDGMTHSECRVYDADGRLLASFIVDAMVRGFGDPTAPMDDRTAL